jgi:hypothetical protein
MKHLAVDDQHPLLPNARGMAVAIATELWNDVNQNPGLKNKREHNPTPTRAVVSEDGESVLLMYDNDSVNPFAGEQLPLER